MVKAIQKCQLKLKVAVMATIDSHPEGFAENLRGGC